MKKQFIIDIDENAEVKIETRGFTGKACLEEAAFLKNILGREVARQLTPAYYNHGRKLVKKHLPLCG